MYTPLLDGRQEADSPPPDFAPNSEYQSNKPIAHCTLTIRQLLK